MRWGIAALILLLVALAASVVLFPEHRVATATDARPKAVRDSVDTVWREQEARHDTFRIWLRMASADTLGAILRDRARRPPVLIHDTISGDTMTTPEDKGSSQECEVAISCHEARSLILRDSALIMLSDSLRGVIAISRAERDSLDSACRPHTPWRAAEMAFVGGYAAGLATCLVLR